MDEQKLHEILQELDEATEMVARSVISSAKALVESPIELAFCTALVMASRILGCRIGLVVNKKIRPSENFDNSGCVALLWPQAHIGAMRVDFMIISRFANETRKCVVECDGHDFHERTKEQAERDRSRDRKLQAVGFRVFRFTGREINRSAFSCAKEVLDWATNCENEVK